MLHLSTLELSDSDVYQAFEGDVPSYPQHVSGSFKNWDFTICGGMSMAPGLPLGDCLGAGAGAAVPLRSPGLFVPVRRPSRVERVATATDPMGYTAVRSAIGERVLVGESDRGNATRQGSRIRVWDRPIPANVTECPDPSRSWVTMPNIPWDYTKDDLPRLWRAACGDD